MISAFFTKANMAAVVGVMAFVISYLPYIIYTQFYMAYTATYIHLSVSGVSVTASMRHALSGPHRQLHVYIF